MLSGDFTSDNRPFGPDQGLAAFAGLTEADGAFHARHIGPTRHDVETMLQSVGADSLEALAAQTLPGDIRLGESMGIGPGWSETEVLARLRAIAARNPVMTSLIGQGYYGPVLPAVILRKVLENPAWYTAHPPYDRKGHGLNSRP